MSKLTDKNNACQICTFTIYRQVNRFVLVISNNRYINKTCTLYLSHILSYIYPLKYSWSTKQNMGGKCIRKQKTFIFSLILQILDEACNILGIDESLDKAVLDKTLPEQFDGFEEFSWHRPYFRLLIVVYQSMVDCRTTVFSYVSNIRQQLSVMYKRIGLQNSKTGQQFQVVCQV